MIQWYLWYSDIYDTVISMIQCDIYDTVWYLWYSVISMIQWYLYDTVSISKVLLATLWWWYWGTSDYVVIVANVEVIWASEQI